MHKIQYKQDSRGFPLLNSSTISKSCLPLLCVFERPLLNLQHLFAPGSNQKLECISLWSCSGVSNCQSNSYLSDVKGTMKGGGDRCFYSPPNILNISFCWDRISTIMSNNYITPCFITVSSGGYLKFPLHGYLAGSEVLLFMLLLFLQNTSMLKEK